MEVKLLVTGCEPWVMGRQVAQILSQDEVDALLQGIANDQVPTGESSNPSAASGATAEPEASSFNDIVPYDFARAEISFIGGLPGLKGLIQSLPCRRVFIQFALNHYGALASLWSTRAWL